MQGKFYGNFSVKKEMETHCLLHIIMFPVDCIVQFL